MDTPGSDCFGWALEESLKEHGLRLRPRHEGCHHHRRGQRALLKRSAVAAMAAAAFDDAAVTGKLDDEGETRTEKERRWYVTLFLKILSRC